MPRTYADYKEMLAREKPQVVLAFPQGLSLYEVNKACLEAGANVFTERPGAETREQVADLARVEERTGRFVLPRFNKRYIPAYQAAREIIGRPEFGGPTMYLAKYHAGEYANEQTFLESHIVHHVDLARFYLGAIKSIRGDIVRIGPKLVGVNASFTAESGAVGVLQSSSLQSRGSYPLERVEITGRQRCVIVDNLTRIEYHRPGSPKTGAERPVLAEGGDSLVWDPSMTQLGNYSHNGFEHMVAGACLVHPRGPNARAAHERRRAHPRAARPSRRVAALSYGTSTILPCDAASITARCASAARASGRLCWMTGRIAPASMAEAVAA